MTGLVAVFGIVLLVLWIFASWLHFGGAFIHVAGAAVLMYFVYSMMNVRGARA